MASRGGPPLEGRDNQGTATLVNWQVGASGALLATPADSDRVGTRGAIGGESRDPRTSSRAGGRTDADPDRPAGSRSCRSGRSLGRLRVESREARPRGSCANPPRSFRLGLHEHRGSLRSGVPVAGQSRLAPGQPNDAVGSRGRVLLPAQRVGFSYQITPSSLPW